jgi:hypothetical protein
MDTVCPPLCLDSIIDGLVLALARLQDDRLRPIDALLRHHFRQGILRYIKGAPSSTGGI